MLTQPRDHSRVPAVCVLGFLILGGLATRAQAPATPEADEAAIEEMLHRTSEAFREKNAERIKASFVENFAGPFRIPKVAQSVLERITKHATQISAGYQMDPLDIVGNRAVGPVEVDLEMEFGGGNRRQDKSFMLMIFAKESGQWLIWSMERLSMTWNIDDVTANDRMTWAEEGLSFPVPSDWGAYPVDSMETRRSVMFVSPDLAAFIGAAFAELPMTMSANAIVQNHQGIGGMFPGSTFVGTEPVKLAGRDGVVTKMDLKLGAIPARVESRLFVTGKTVVVASLTVTPASDVETYRKVFSDFCSGLTFTPPEAAQGAEIASKKTFEGSGIAFSAPEGWEIESFGDDMAKKRQWLFGATIKPTDKDSFALIGGRDLPTDGVDLQQLRKGEMDQLRSVAESTDIGEASDIDIDGTKALSWTVSFKVGVERKRREVFILKGRRLYFLVADAVPPSDFDMLNQGVDALIKTIKFTD